MSRSRFNGCITWGGSIFTAAVISIFIGIMIIFGLVKIALLQIIWKEEKIQNELEISFNSFPPFSSSTLLSFDSHVEKDEYCLITGPLAVIDAKYSSSAQPINVFNYYDQQLKEEGWSLSDYADWNNDLRAGYYKEGGYYAYLEYFYPQQGTYHLQMKWEGGRYPCE